MKKTLKAAGSLLLCLCFISALLCGCGKNTVEETTAPASSETEETQAEERVAVDACYDNDETGESMILKDDYTIVCSNWNAQVEGEYFIEGSRIHVDLYDMGQEGTIDSEGNITIEDVDGIFCRVDEAGYVPVPEEPEEKKSMSGIYNNDFAETSLEFYPDFTVTLSDAYSQTEGTYYILGDRLYMEIDGVQTEGTVYVDAYNEETIQFENSDVPYTAGWWYTRGDEIQFGPEPGAGTDAGGEAALTIPSGGNKSEEYVNDTDLCYTDYDGNISVVYPETMKNYENALGDGTILISDGNQGYKFGMVITEEYKYYPDTDNNFIADMMSEKLRPVFITLYGENDALTGLTFSEPEEGVIISGLTTFYRGMQGIDLNISLYETYMDGEGTGVYMLECIYTDTNHPEQLENMKNVVGPFTSVN